MMQISIKDYDLAVKERTYIIVIIRIYCDLRRLKEQRICLVIVISADNIPQQITFA
ncbi:MAG: hypothetical protein IKN25_09265 [Spirochaetales bacterium]|nr:hypothetical protein [Spirochaetales bacterium]